MLSPRILVIDDEPLVRWSLREKLSDWGFSARCAGDGEEGLRLFGEERFDAVLLDLRMPGLDGREVLRRLRELSADVPVLVITASAPEEGGRAFPAGATGVLGKPFCFDDLRAAIDGVLGE